MRKLIILALAAIPSMALAMPNRAMPSSVHLDTANTASYPHHQMIDPNGGAPGAGNVAKSNGDVTGPGDRARIDTSSKGPLDDRNVGGQESEDVPSSAHPRPIY